MAWRINNTRRAPTPDRLRNRLVLVGLLLLVAGALLSDGGVLADEGGAAVNLSEPAAMPSTLPTARVLKIGDRGWLEVMRPWGNRPAPVTVVTGFDGLACEQDQTFSQHAFRYRELVKTGQDGAGIRCGLGNSLFLDGDLVGAVRAFTWASSGYPNNPDVQNGLGNVLAELGLVGQAQTEFKELSSRPDYRAVAHNNLGNAFKNASRLPEALEQYARALKIDPDLVAAQ